MLLLLKRKDCLVTCLYFAEVLLGRFKVLLFVILKASRHGTVCLRVPMCVFLWNTLCLLWHPLLLLRPAGVAEGLLQPSSIVLWSCTFRSRRNRWLGFGCGCTQCLLVSTREHHPPPTVTHGQSPRPQVGGNRGNSTQGKRVHE